MVQAYNPSVFNNLPTFEQAISKPLSSQSVVRELGNIICRHNLEKVIGLSLLHKHFSLDDQEILLRRKEGNEMLVEPAMYAETVEPIPYMWAVALNRNGTPSFYPIEFLEESGITSVCKSLAESLAGNEHFLLDFATKLVEFNAHNHFGISLIPHSLFQFNSDETLLETDNHDTRGQRISVIKKAALSKIKSDKTLWVFNKEQGEDMLSLDCTFHCAVHCGVHCGVHVD